MALDLASVPLMVSPYSGVEPRCPRLGCDGRMRMSYAADALECGTCFLLVSCQAMQRVLREMPRGICSGQALVDNAVQIAWRGIPPSLRSAMEEHARRVEHFERVRVWHWAFDQAFGQAVENFIGPYVATPPKSALPDPTTGQLAVVNYNGIPEQSETYFDASAALPDDEPVLAWRAWNIVPQAKGRREGEPIMRSVTYHVQWHPRIAHHARCANWWKGSVAHSARPHEAPDRSCTCGIYAKRTASGAASWTARDGMVKAIGRVQLWGRTLLYTEGYRAEYAYPYDIWLPRTGTPAVMESYDRWGGIDRLASTLRNLYAIDVTILDVEAPPHPDERG